jgi:predicted alpha/beta hydrolase family esterase
MSNKKHIVIIHGAYGSPAENWFPWLSGKLTEDGHRVSVPILPTPEGQTLSNWLNIFEEQVGKLDENMILVGHSLAPGFILNLLERSSVKILGIFLVSGFLGKLGLEDFDPINESFVCGQFDWDKIRGNAGSIYVFNSDNDPYVPLEKGEELSNELGVELNVIHNGGHINADAGYKEVPFLLDAINSILK